MSFLKTEAPPPPQPLVTVIDVRYVPLIVDLCHWMCDHAEMSIQVDHFFDEITDGVALMRCANKLSRLNSEKNEEPNNITGFTERKDLGPGKFFVRLNMETFIRWSKNFGCDPEICCTVAELVDKKDLVRVLSNIHAMCRVAATKRLIYPPSVRMEVETGMHYNHIVSLFDKDPDTLDPAELHAKQCFVDLVNDLELGPFTLDDNIGKMKRKWKEALNGVIIGVDAVEEDEEGGDEEEE